MSIDLQRQHDVPPPADAVELEVFKHLFAAVAEEMGVRLMRSAYSPNIKERRDFSCALCDAQGDLVAQAEHIPVHLGAMPLSVQAVIECFGLEAMRPGDRFVLNDPFAGGTHLPDITVLAPLVLPGESQPRFFVANRAHHADVGGRSAGSMALATSIDDEGVRIPPSRLDEALLERICSASRTPDERRGDLQAQLAALDAGLGRLQEMIRSYGAKRVSLRARELLDYTERITRAALRRLPAGVYSFEDFMDGDGVDALDIAIRCQLTIGQGGAVVDFSESDKQVRGPVNAVRTVTVSAVNYCFRCLVASDIPTNSGVMRPIRVITRPGTVVDALPPAAVAAGNVETSQRIVDVVLGALAPAAPELIPAASQGTMNNLTIGGIDPRTGEPFAYYETIGGGAGGGPQHAGASGLHTHMTNTLNTPVEALEHAYPLRVEQYSLRAGSGGAGQHRGGEGLVRRIVVDCAGDVTLLSERRRRAPYGLHGGTAGQAGADCVIDSAGLRTPVNGKCALKLAPGEQIEIATPGGGGWGEAVPELS